MSACRVVAGGAIHRLQFKILNRRQSTLSYLSEIAFIYLKPPKFKFLNRFGRFERNQSIFLLISHTCGNQNF